MTVAGGPAGTPGAARVAVSSPRRIALVGIGSGLLAMVLATAAAVLDEPMIFPSLGPTAFLLVAQSANPVNSPRSVLVGHAAGLLAGSAALHLFGLADAGSAVVEGVTGARIGAVGLSVGLTAALLLGLRSLHAPACATTLIVSLGLLPRFGQHVVMLGAVVVMVAVAVAVRVGVSRPNP